VQERRENAPRGEALRLSKKNRSLLFSHSGSREGFQSQEGYLRNNLTAKRNLYVSKNRVALCLFSILMSVHAGAGTLHRFANAIPNSYFVKLKAHPGVSHAEAVTRVKARSAGKIVHLLTGPLDGFTIRMTAAEAAGVANDPLVSDVYEDIRVMEPPYIQTPVGHWGQDRIDQDALPLDGTFGYGFTGLGVTAYVIDTGIAPNSDFANRMITQINFWTDASGVRDPANYADCTGHGTLIADALGGTVYGVAKNVNFIGVRTYGCSAAESSALDLLAGLEWARTDHVQRGGSAVVNVSQQLSAGYTPVDDAITGLVSSGMAVFLSAGNDFGNAAQFSPQRMGNTPGVLTVGASTMTDTVAAFSNQGSVVKIFAPGQDIWLMGAGETVQKRDGTSLSAPIAAGVGAMFLQQTPGSTAAQIDSMIVGWSSVDKLSGVSTYVGTPNRLLYSHSRGPYHR
jgi:subtilisin family serine protease